jgi:hypothetical protein
VALEEILERRVILTAASVNWRGEGD